MLSSPKPALSRVDYLDYSAEDANHGRIRQLHDRWQEIHQEIDREKQNRRDTIEEQVAMLEERIVHKRQADEGRIAVQSRSFRSSRAILTPSSTWPIPKK